MRRLLFVLASIIAVLTFSCDTTQPDFDDSVPGINTLTTNVSPEEGGTIEPSEGEFVEGTSIEIEAIPNAGYIFERWEGDLVGGLNPAFLSMNRDRNVTAFFTEAEIPLTINIVGEGTVLQEIVEQQTEQPAVAATTTLEEEKPETLQPSPDGNSNVMLQQGEERLLTRDRPDEERTRPDIPDERGEQAAIQQQQVKAQSQKVVTTFKLTAEPSAGWEFARWEGDLTGSQNPDTLVVEDATVVTAVFEEIETQLFVLELTVEGQGFVEAVPDKLEYSAGEEVTLTATAETGWRFSEWRGDLAGSENPATILMDSNKDITSAFVMEGAPEMVINQEPSETVAGETISPAPSVQILSSTGDPLGGIDVSVSLNNNDFSSSSATVATTNAEGIAQFNNLVIETAGSGYRISFAADDSDIANVTSSQFTIVSASGDPSNSSATVPNGIAGEPTEIIISVEDAFGNPVSGAAAGLAVTISGANEASPSVQESGGAGEYITSYTPENAGEDQVVITLNDTGIEGSPFSSVVSTSDVSAANSSAEVEPDEITVGENATLTVTARDDQNNPLAGLENEIIINGLGKATAGNFTENADGVYVTQITGTVPGEISLSVSVTGVSVADGILLTFLAGSPENIEIVSGNNQTGGVTETLDNSFVVRVSDVFGNPVEDTTVEFEIDNAPVAAVGQSLSSESAETNADGEASTVLTLGSIPGEYTVNASSAGLGSVTFSAQAVIGQPSVINLVTQPSPTTAGNTINPAPEVEITDDENNPIEGVEVSAALQGAEFADGTTTRVTTNSSGIARFDNLLVNTAGSGLSIRFETDVSGLDDLVSESFIVNPAEPDLSAITATVPNGSAGDPTEILISVEDTFGNRVEGVASSISLSVESGPNSDAEFSSVQDEGNGEYSASYTPESIGTDQISITFNGSPLSGSPYSSNIITTDAELVELATQPGNAVAGTNIPGPPAVRVTDSNNNPVAQIDVTVSVSGGSLASGTTTKQTNSSGEAVFDNLVIETAGNYRLQFNALGVSENAVSGLFEISASNADQLERVSGNGQTGTVAEALNNPFEVEVTDPFGNPVSGFAVEFTIEGTPEGAGGQSLSSESTTTDVDGRASTILTLGDRVGNYSVEANSAVGSVSFNATAIPGNAQSFLFDEISSPQTAGASFLVSISAFDKYDNIATGYSGTAALSTTAGAITPNSVNFEDGEASQSIRVSGAGSGQTITATDGSISGTTNEFDVQTGGASDAEITQQPTNAIAGQVISPSPAVEVTDAQGNPVSGIDVEANLSSGSFASGTATQTTNTSGIATFGNLSVETAGDYTILFDVLASGVNDPESTQFSITPAGADPQNTDASVPDGAAGEETVITITVEDAFGNRVSGVENLLSVSISGANSATPDVSEMGDGIYNASYIPEASGTDQVAITLNGTPISRSPYSSTVSTSDISSSVSSVSANPETLPAGSSSQVTVLLRDGSNNPISGLSNTNFNVSVSGNGNSGSVSETSDGTYQFNVRNITAQQVTVTVNADGVTLDDTPQITFTAADPNLIAIPQGSQPGTSVAGEAITNSPSVRVLDEFGNSVPGVNVSVDELGGQPFESGTQEQTTNSNGIVLFDDLVITQSGDYRLVFTAPGGLSTTSQSFGVEAAEADAGTTTATVPNGSAGDQTDITITVRDEFGNLVEGVEGDLSVSISGDNAGVEAETITDEGEGIYSTAYTPIVNGTDQVIIELNGTGIQGSPFTSNVITSDAENVELNTQPASSTAGETIQGSPSVIVTDDFDNPVEGVEVIAAANGPGSIVSGTTSVNTNRSGIAVFSDLVINTAGSYTLEFNAIGVSENAVSDPFEIDPAEASRVNRVDGNNQTGTITEQLDDPLVVLISDVFGNPISGHTVQFEIDQSPSGASGQQLSSRSGDSDSDGLVSVELTLGNIAGIYSVIVNAGSAGSVTFSATAIAGEVASFSFDEIPDPQTAGQPFGIRIAALDSQGNTVINYQGTADLAAQTGTVTPNEADFINGIAELDVSLETAAPNQSITAADGTITGTSNTFDVQSGGVNAANSSVSADRTSLPAGESSTVTIELRDGSNNPLAGLEGDVTVNLTGNATSGPVTGNGSGTYTSDITNQTAESVTVTVSVDGVTLNDSPSIEFTPAAADDLTIVSGNNQSAEVTQQLTEDFIVRLADTFDNSISGRSVQFSITNTPAGATGQSLSNTTGQTNSSGEASTRLTLGDTPGSYTVEASVSGVGTVTFTAEAVTGAPSQMTIVTQPENTRAGQPISPAPQVQITDIAGNPVANISVTVSEDGGYIFDGGTLTRSTNASGLAAFDDLVIQSSGRYILVFNASASGVANVTSNSFNVNPGVGDAGSSTLELPDGTAGEETEIKIRVEDEFGNAVDGAESDLSVTVSEANSATPAVTATAAAGEYAAIYTPLSSGEDRVEATLSGIALSNSPQFSTVSTSGVSASESIVLANPGVLQVGDVSVVTVELKDGSGNPIGGLGESGFFLSTSGNATAGSVSETSTAGTYEFTVQNTTAQQVQVTVEAQGTELDDKPQITFNAGDPADISIVSNPGSTNAGEIIPGSPAVEVFDEFNNSVPNAGVTVTEQSGQAFASGANIVLTNSSGIAVFDDLVINTSGQYNLVFTVSGSITITSNAFSIDPADADPASTIADVPNGASGNATNITITVEDAFENRVTEVAGNLAVTIGGENSGASVAPITDDGNGLYSTSYTPVSAGTDQVTITLNSLEIAGSPYTSVVTTSDADAVAIETQPLQTVAGQPIAGPPAARVTDAGNNEVSGVEVIAGLQSGSFNSGTTSVDTDGSGIATFTDLVLNTAGSYVMEFNAVGVSEDAVSQSFEVIAANADELSISDGNNQTGTVTKPLPEPLDVLVTDPFGNPVSNQEVSFDITSTPAGATGQTLTTLVAETGLDGLLSTELTLGNRPGTYEVTASSNGLTDVIFTATAEAGPATAYEFDTIPTPQTAGQPFTISLTALDEQSNTADSYGETVTLSASQGVISPSSTQFTNGTVSLDVSLDQAGSGITITATDGTISETSNTIDVQTGGVDAANSSVVASSPSLPAGQTTQLTIDLRDGNNNAVEGLTDSDFVITVTGSGTADAVSETGTPGTYTADITNQTAETVTATVTASGTELNDTPTIEFTPADADPAATTANVPNGAAGDATSIVITVLDQFGNSVPGSGDDLAVSVTDGPNSGASFSAITDNGDGTYSTSYTPDAIGTDEITITLSGTGISGSPYSSVVTASDVSAANSNATANPTTLEVGSPSTVTVDVRDGSNNPIAGLLTGDFNVSVSGSGTAGSVSETSTAGTYEFTVSNETAQTVTVTITATGTTLQDKPEITYTAADPARITVSTQPDDVIAGQLIPGPPAVILEDSFNNPIPGINVTVTEQGGQTFASGTLTVQTDASGEALFGDLVISEVGQYNLVFSEAGGETATSNIFNVSPAGADASSSTANVPNGAATDFTSITITVEDPFGNRVSGVAGDLAVSIGGTNSGSTVDPITDDGNGLYSTGYTPSTVGTDEITITLASVEIAGSPYTSNVVTSDAETVAVETQPLQTVAGQPIAGPPAARVTDAGNNEVSGVEVIAGLQSGTFDAGTTSVSTDAGGIATYLDLVINTAGSYVMEFNAVGVTDDASSQPFEIVAADPASMVIDSGNNQTGTVTASLVDPFAVQISDAFGNPVEGEPVTFAISSQPAGATSTSLTETSVVTDANGEASTQLTLGSRSGSYQVTASADGLADVTFTATAEAGPATAYEFDTVPSPQTAGQPFTISLTALDNQGNTADSYGETVTLSASQGVISPSSTQFTNGTVSLDVSLDQAGSGITITATDGTISETSNTIDVQTGGVDAANSSASANPTQLQAGETSQLTIELRDGNNNAVSELANTDFVISVSGSGSASTVSETATQGTYTANIDNQAAETVTVTVTADGTTLNDSPSIEFTTADASTVSQVSGNNQTGTVLEQLTEDFVVRVEDAFQNPVEGESVTFGISGSPTGASGQTLSVTSALTDADGVAATRLTFGDEPGTYTVDAAAAGLPAVSFSADAEIGAATQMNITAQPAQTTAGNVISPSPEVLVTDNAGNPVEGVNVTVSEQSGVLFDSGTNIQTTNASGLAAFNNLVFQKADTYTLVFNANAAGVTDVNSDPFDVIPAAGSPVNSSAVVPDGVAGEATSITITVLDEFDNPVAGEGTSLAASVTSGPNTGSVFTSVSDNGDGTYSTSYIPENDGTDQVSITLGGSAINGSPFTSQVSTGEVSATNSLVTADPATLQAGSNSLVTVDLRDGSNNPISGLEAADFSVTVSGSASAGTLSETSTDGTYQFIVSNTVAEQVTITVAAAGTMLSDSPEITFRAADPDLMIISTEPLNSTAGEPIAGPPAVTITDDFNNPVPNAEVTVTEQGSEPFSTGSVTSVNTNTQGVATFSNLAIESVGQYNLVFSSAGVINRTSNAFDVEAAGPNAAQTTADVPNGSAGDQTNITITVRDEFGNRVEGVSGQLSVEIQGENAGAAVALISENGNGVYSTSYTPESTGTDQVVIAVNSEGIQGSPFESTIDNSDADNVAISQQPLQTLAGNTIAGPPSVLVTDEFGNTVSGVEVTVREQSGAGFDGGTLTVSTGASGIAEFSNLQINTSGAYTLVYDAVGVGTDAVSAIFDVVAGDGDPVQTTAVVPNGTSNETTTITMTVRDAFGNTVEGVAADVAVSISGGPNQGVAVATIQDDGGGSYSTSYTPTNSGTDEITITLSGTQISNSPYSSDVSAGTATTLQLSQQPSATTAGDAISPAPTALLTDSEGNGVSGVNVTATLSSNIFTLASTTLVSTNQDGLAIFDNLVIETAGAGYSITFDADAAGVPNVSSALFDVTAATASTINEISGSGQSAEVTTALANPFVVEVVDAFGNRVANETVDYSINNTPAGATGQSLSSASVQSNSEGLASTVLTLGSTSGSYTTQAAFGAETVSFTADATPGTADSYDFDAIGSPQTAGTAFSITLQALDSQANVDTSYSGTATLTTTAGTISPASATFTDGVATVSVSVTDAGTGQTITANDGTISATSGTFDVGPGAVSASVSSASATSPHTADGTDASTVTINLTDENGNVIIGLADADFTIDAGANATPGTVSETATGGTYEVLITNTTAEIATVSIVADGITLDDQPQVDFQAGPATSYSFDAISSPQTAGTLFEIVITALDGNLNTATSYTGTATLTTTAGTIDPGSVTFTDGVATVSVSVTDAGTGQTITANDGTISATSGTFDVEPGAVSASVSLASATSPHTADGTDASTVTINLTDENGNEISGLADVDFTIDAGANATPGTVSETATGGTYEVLVTNNTAETVTVTVTANSVTLEDSPTITFESEPAP